MIFIVTFIAFLYWLFICIPVGAWMHYEKISPTDKPTFSISGILTCSFLAFMTAPAFLLAAFEKHIGWIIPRSDRIQHDIDDSMISIKTCRCNHSCRCNIGSNVSASPDQL